MLDKFELSEGHSAFEVLQRNQRADLIWALYDQNNLPIAAIWKAQDVVLKEISIDEIRLTYHISGSTKVVAFENGRCKSFQIKNNSVAMTTSGSFNWEINGEITFAHVYLWPENTQEIRRKFKQNKMNKNIFFLNDQWLSGFFSMLISYTLNDQITQSRFLEKMIPIISDHLQLNHQNWNFKKEKHDLSGGLSSEKLLTIQNYLQKNISKAITIKELAAIAAYSESHFYRAFKASTGISPHQYFLNLRLEVAKKNLRNKQLNIYQVGQAVGFKTAAQFTNVFTQKVGLSPSEYRTKVARSDD